MLTLQALILISHVFGTSIAPWADHDLVSVYAPKEHSKRAMNAWNRLNFAPSGVEIAIENKR